MNESVLRLRGRVLIVDGKSMTGGGQRMLSLIARAVADHDPVVVRPLASNDQAALPDMRVERLHFPAYPKDLRNLGPMLKMLPQVLVTAWQLRLCIQRYQIKLVIANDLYSIIPLIPATAGLRIPLIFYAHSCDLPASASRLLARCSGIIACSRAAADTLPRPQTLVRVVHNAADVPRSLSESAPARSPDEWIIGYSGRIDANKNLLGLIAAFAQALPVLDRRGPPATLEILGDGTPDHLRELRATVDRLGVGARIRWLPWTDQPLPVMAGWDAIVLASHLESFGLCLIEAQMLGKPVMGTRCGGIPEIIEDGLNGILAASPAAADLAEGLIRLRAAGPEMASEGQRLAYQRFSPAAYGKNLRQALSELALSSPLTVGSS